MKKIMNRAVILLCMATSVAYAQNKYGDQRMEQDMEVAENILSTLLRQQYQRRNFFPVSVESSYTQGYGVTFRVPIGGPFNGFIVGGEPTTVNVSPDGISYSWSRSSSDEMKIADREVLREKRRMGEPVKAGTEEDDSTSAVNYERFVKVAKDFLADYSDVLSQLKPEEHIVVTNKSGGGFGDDMMFTFGGRRSPRRMISVDAVRADVSALRQGKMTREQFLSKLKIVNAESAESLDPDLEVFSSMLNRLYREDLSKTYFANHVTYERMKNYGVIYYMSVYSSNEVDENYFDLPTVNMRHVNQKERDAKVKELYPRFESDLKENLVDYGRTLKSVGPDELIVVNAKLTKCLECGIPAAIEVSVKGSVLNDYGAGKITRDVALSKVNVKKMGQQ